MSIFSETHWSSTFHLNAVRVLSATVTLVVLYLLGRVTGVVPAGHSPTLVAALSLLVVPAGLLVFGMAAILTLKALASMGVPMMEGPAGLASLIVVLFIAIGDPLIWTLRKYYPAIVPVDEFRFVNPRALILVRKELS
jgi:hypothetical protein